MERALIVVNQVHQLLAVIVIAIWPARPLVSPAHGSMPEAESVASRKSDARGARLALKLENKVLTGSDVGESSGVL